MVSSSHHISQDPLGAVLLALETRRESSEVEVDSAAGSALLALRDGKLIDATFGDLKGVEAIRAVLRLQQGKYVVRERTSTEAGPMNERVSDVLRAAGFKLELLQPKATLALGTRVPLTQTGKTIRSSTSGSEPSANGESSREKKSDPPRGRWGRKRSEKLEATGYSSVPPPSLAEDRIPIPLVNRRDNSSKLRALTSERTQTPTQRVDEMPLGAGESMRAARVRAAQVRAEMFTPPPPSSKEELDEEVVSAAAGQLRESEMPVPSSRLDPDALRQLDVLNEALGSSPKSSAALQDLMAPFPTDDFGASSPHSDTMQSRRQGADSAPPTADEALGINVEVEDPVSSVGPSSSAPPAPGSVPHPDLLPGPGTSRPGALPVVGRYEVLSRLKRGGMGSVYMCRMTASAGFRRLFAMKVLHSHLVEQPEALDAFFHEARVLGGLHHRNIVGIADVGSPSEPYIVLEYVEGGSLAEIYRATRKKRRDPAMIVTILLDALSGLSAAHHATGETNRPLHLVHCDISPHNLLVGIDGTCRLTDFGAARTGQNQTDGEVIHGKPTYLAPERIERRPSDHRSDLFSLGVVLYSGLTGVDLFSAEDSDAMLRNVMRQPIEPPSRVGWRPPACLDEVCLKALARDPTQRYQSADEMAEHLRRVAIENGLLSSPIEVAGWVSDVLGPTLKARRIASMRGAEPNQEARNWRTLPPPPVSGSEEESAAREQAPQEQPSSAEITGPLEPPPSSHGFDERTQILGPESSRPARTRAQRLTLYFVVLAALLCVVWMAMRPGSAAPFFRMSPDPSANQAGPLPAPQTPAKAAPEAEDPDKIVIDIQPSSTDR